ncbi:DoxX family protein [Actinokineospora sp. HUAS TT18]|uniref:DoxX family protein n=1 Tax=Actinokineospora sp. HUAS TT18 TaxID=3447451 RepID=UPI003F525A70
MILRRLARPLLAAIFISSGIDALKASEAHAEAAKPLLDGLKGKLPEQIPSDPVTLVRIDGAIKVGAGVLLALGKFPRLSALALAGGLVPTTLATHRFWDEKDPAVRQQQQVQFTKNLGLFGGLLLASADTAGKPSLGWRARHTAHEVGDWARETGETVAETVADVPKKAKKVLAR